MSSSSSSSAAAAAAAYLGVVLEKEVGDTKIIGGEPRQRRGHASSQNNIGLHEWSTLLKGTEKQARRIQQSVKTERV